MCLRSACVLMFQAGMSDPSLELKRLQETLRSQPLAGNTMPAAVFQYVPARLFLLSQLREMLALPPAFWVLSGELIGYRQGEPARRHVTHVCCSIVVFRRRTGRERGLGIPAARLGGLTSTARHTLKEGVSQNSLATWQRSALCAKKPHAQGHQAETAAHTTSTDTQDSLSLRNPHGRRRISCPLSSLTLSPLLLPPPLLRLRLLLKCQK